MIRMLGSLFRWRLSLMNGVTSVAGYRLFPHESGQWSEVAVLFVAVTLLAAGASALNQVLERDLDGLMLRTSSRPLPAGVLSPPAAAMLGWAAIAAGLLLLVGGGIVPAVLAGAVTLWYLAVYTPLKRRTGFSLLLGALCGALPPLIGWTFAGGHWLEFPPLLLSLLLYLWQVPHFWLLQRRHADEYRWAGFKVLALPSHRVNPLLLLALWVTAIMTAALMFPLFGLIRPAGAASFLALCAPLLLLLSRRFERPLFTYLNLFPLLLTGSLLS